MSPSIHGWRTACPEAAFTARLIPARRTRDPCVPPAVDPSFGVMRESGGLAWMRAGRVGPVHLVILDDTDAAVRLRTLCNQSLPATSRLVRPVDRHDVVEPPLPACAGCLGAWWTRAAAESRSARARKRYWGPVTARARR
jgi:hypothetical protein